MTIMLMFLVVVHFIEVVREPVDNLDTLGVRQGDVEHLAVGDNLYRTYYSLC